MSTTTRPPAVADAGAGQQFQGDKAGLDGLADPHVVADQEVDQGEALVLAVLGRDDVLDDEEAIPDPGQLSLFRRCPGRGRVGGGSTAGYTV